MDGMTVRNLTAETHDAIARYVGNVRANTKLIEDRDADGKLWRVRRVCRECGT
jgi:hypothetical protein